MLLIGIVGLVLVTALFVVLWWLVEPTAVESLFKIEGSIEQGQVYSDLKDSFSADSKTNTVKTPEPTIPPVAKDIPSISTEEKSFPSHSFPKQVPLADDKGSIGEHKVADVLSRLDRNQYYTINNLLLKVNGSTVQIDHVVVSVYGVFVIETKNYKGVIYGAQDSENWDQQVYDNKYQFRNPILQNLGHIGALKYTLYRNDGIFIPIVVFTGDCVLKVKASNCSIIPLSALQDNILSRKFQILSPAEASQIAHQLVQANISSPINDQKHIDEVKRKADEAERSIRSGICPRCGSELVVKTEGYDTFMICKNHPRCSFSTKPRR